MSSADLFLLIIQLTTILVLVWQLKSKDANAEADVKHRKQIAYKKYKESLDRYMDTSDIKREDKP